MKRLRPLIVSILLCHCGTEVGNGVATPGEGEPGAGTGTPSPTSTVENSAPQADKTASPEVSGSAAIVSPSLLAACASPFAETIVGTFLKNGTPAFTVTPTGSGQKAIAREDGSLLYVITPRPTVSTYAIDAVADAPPLSCSAVSSQSLADGTIERSVSLSNGSLVRWIVSSGRVTLMRVTTANMSEETWTHQ